MDTARIRTFLLPHCFSGIVVLSLLAGMGFAPVLAEGVDRIVAVVEDEVILESELQKKVMAIRQGLMRSDTDMPSGIALARQVLDRLIMKLEPAASETRTGR